MQDNRPDRPDAITLPPLILAATIALGVALNFFWPASFRRPRNFGDTGDDCGEYAPS